MEKEDNVCPICSLFMREGITLKEHLQTHSKGLMIAALLNKANFKGNTSTYQEHQNGENPEEGNNGAATAVIAEHENRINTTVQLQDNQTYSATSRSAAVSTSISASSNSMNQPSLFVSRSQNQGNFLQQPTGLGFGNIPHAYQTFFTNEGNLLLVPTYTICSPSTTVLPSNISNPANTFLTIPTTPCSTSSTIHAFPSNAECTILTQSIPTECSDTYQDANTNINDNDLFDNDNESKMVLEMPNNEEGKNSNNEVQNILKADSFTEESVCSEDEEYYAYSDHGERAEHDVQIVYTSDSNDGKQTNLDSKSCCSSVINELKPSELGIDMNENACDPEIDSNMMPINLHVSSSSKTKITQITNESKQTEFMNDAGPSSRQHILSNNTSELCREKPKPIRGTFTWLENESKINEEESTISEVVNIDYRHGELENNNENYVISDSAREIKDEECSNEYYSNIGSPNNSQVSPINIQTDEAMPPSGELSEIENSCSVDNSVWDMRVQRHEDLKDYKNETEPEDNQNENSPTTSFISKTHCIPSNLTANQINTDMCKKELLKSKKTKKKMVKEFHCYFCKESFASLRLRQIHITTIHAEEDCLSIESLFGKRLRVMKNESVIDIKNETNELTAEEHEIEVVGLDDYVTCRVCDDTLKSGVQFVEHLREMHNIKKRSYVCPTCLVRFEDSKIYVSHIQKVHPYECMTCSKKFYTRGGFMLHQKRHMLVKPYSCDKCDKSFVTKQKLTEHTNVHTGEQPIECEICGLTFKRYSNCMQHKKHVHLKIRRKQKDFICDCGEIFHSKSKLTWHQEIHDNKPKQCTFCVERFVHTSSLTRHIRKWHDDKYLSASVNKKNTKNVTCPVCSLSVLHSSLPAHLKIHDENKDFNCSECSKSFRTKWNLQLHKWTHSSRSAKPYKCKLCVKAYIHKTDFDAHLRSHNNNRPYACNVCGKQFIRKYNCARHVKEHFEPRAFKCKECGKLFSRSYYLTEHEKIHSGEKPHVCQLCGKASATKSNHNKHIKMHTIGRETLNAEN